MVHILIMFLALSASAESGKRFLPTGTTFRATITNSIFSYNIETPVIAELDSDAQFCDPTAPSSCGPTVFPRKTRLIGRALVLKSNDRVNVEFSLAVLPDGREMSVQAIALSPVSTAHRVYRSHRF